MNDEFELYWQRLLESNPILKLPGATAKLDSNQLKKCLLKAFDAGASQVESEMDRLIGEGNSIFGRIFGK